MIILPVQLGIWKQWLRWWGRLQGLPGLIAFCLSLFNSHTWLSLPLSFSVDAGPWWDTNRGLLRALPWSGWLLQGWQGHCGTQNQSRILCLWHTISTSYHLACISYDDGHKGQWFLYQGWVNVTSGSEEALKVAIASRGPVSVAIDASHKSLSFYSNGQLRPVDLIFFGNCTISVPGVYYEPECSSTDLDHAVLAVGYGTIGGEDYWLVQNKDTCILSKENLSNLAILGEELMVNLLGKRWICVDVSKEQQLRGSHGCNLCPSRHEGPPVIVLIVLYSTISKTYNKKFPVVQTHSIHALVHHHLQSLRVFWYQLWLSQNDVNQMPAQCSEADTGGDFARRRLNLI